MDTGPKYVLGGIVVAAALGSLAGLWNARTEAPPPIAASPPAAAPAAVTQAPPPADATPAQAAVTAPAPDSGPPPSFDVVRVTPRGEAVIAGRAAPGAEVVVRDGSSSIGSTRADGRGEFVLVPEKKLDPGSRSLSLEARASGESAPRESAADVVMFVPERNKDVAGRPATESAGPLALLVPREGNAPARPLQMPGAAAGKAKDAPGAGKEQDRLEVDIVEYDAAGEAAVGGEAEPGAILRVFLGDTLIGEARAAEDGRWTVLPKAPVAPGTYTLRVEQLRPDGSVSARLALPFHRAVVPAGMPVNLLVVVQPGHNLWQIARESYGSGLRYAVIYAANKAQIAHPDLIYPGQVFTVPAAN